jgi:ABC-type nitrate/sulfonate/bicarbonate transport system substrate-binding protein
MQLVRTGRRVTAVWLTLAAVSVLLLVAGCHVPGTSAAASAPSQTITVAVVPAVGDAPLYVGVHDGIFRQHGLRVIIKNYPTMGPVLAALRNGSAQVAAGDYTAFLYKQAHGTLSPRLIADGYDAAPGTTEVLTLPGSKITTPQDLEGATVAAPSPQVAPDNGAPYDIQTLAAQAVLESDGVSPDTVHWRPTPVGDMISALRAGKVDAILATEPYVYEAESQLGAQELIDVESGVAAGLPELGYFSLQPYASGNAAKLHEFRAALFQAQAKAAIGGPVQTVLPRTTGMTAQDAALITLGSYPTSLSVGQVQRVAQLMFETGMTRNLITVNGVG